MVQPRKYNLLRLCGAGFPFGESRIRGRQHQAEDPWNAITCRRTASCETRLAARKESPPPAAPLVCSSWPREECWLRIDADGSLRWRTKRLQRGAYKTRERSAGYRGGSTNLGWA